MIIVSCLYASLLFTDYEGIFVHGQFRDAISLQDEISVSMDEGDELVEDLRENGKRYKNCISKCPWPRFCMKSVFFFSYTSHVSPSLGIVSSIGGKLFSANSIAIYLLTNS